MTRDDLLRLDAQVRLGASTLKGWLLADLPHIFFMVLDMNTPSLKSFSYRGPEPSPRAKTMLDAHNNGTSYRQIGRDFGISGGRVSQIVWQARRIEDRRAKLQLAIEKSGDDPLALPVHCIGFSSRVCHVLRSSNCETLGDLLNFAPHMLLRLENLGKISLTEIERVVADLGLKFEYNPEHFKHLLVGARLTLDEIPIEDYWGRRNAEQHVAWLERWLSLPTSVRRRDGQPVYGVVRRGRRHNVYASDLTDQELADKLGKHRATLKRVKIRIAELETVRNDRRGGSD